MPRSVRRIDLRIDDDQLYERLVEAARRDHRSIHREVIALLEAQLDARYGRTQGQHPAGPARSAEPLTDEPRAAP
jgi:hypothetical protein